MNKPDLRRVGIRDVIFGRNVTVIEPCNLYGCEIGENSFVGPFVEIQKGVKVGRSCRIQSHAFLCDGVHIGDNGFISHGAMFINDLFSDGHRAMGDTSLYKKTILGKGVLIGTNATILPVQIADGVVVGAGSVVTKDLIIKGIYAGNPAKLIKKL